MKIITLLQNLSQYKILAISDFAKTGLNMEIIIYTIRLFPKSMRRASQMKPTTHRNISQFLHLFQSPEDLLLHSSALAYVLPSGNQQKIATTELFPKVI